MTAEAIITTLLTAQQVQAQRQAQKAQARTLEGNAAIARQEAAREESEIRRRNRQVLGRQRARFAKSGLKLEGTPLLVQADTAAEGEMDALAARRGGEVRANQLSDRSRALRGQAGASVGRTLLTGVLRRNPGFPTLI